MIQIGADISQSLLSWQVIATNLETPISAFLDAIPSNELEGMLAILSERGALHVQKRLKPESSVLQGAARLCPVTTHMFSALGF